VIASLVFVYDWLFLPALALVCIALALHRRTPARIVAALGGVLILLGRTIQYLAHTNVESSGGDLVAMFGPLLILGGIFLWWTAQRKAPPNPTPHADARDALTPASDGGARAGGRER